MKASKDTVMAKIEVIDRNLTYLSQVKEDFRAEEAEYERLQAVKHSLFEIAEACIDIASHIIAAEGFTRPDTYSEMFVELAENNLISDSLGKRLSQMARFRNLLVHHYHEVEKEELVEILDQGLPDVKNYVKDVYSYLSG